MRILDRRNPDRTGHGRQTPVGQPIAAITLGTEPVLAGLSESLPPTRKDRAGLAGKSTPNRLEHCRTGGPTRDHKIGQDTQAIEILFVDLARDAHNTPPKEIILDLDAPTTRSTDTRKTAFSAVATMPLRSAGLRFCGRHLLAAKLRRSNIDASKGSVGEIERIVRQILTKRRRMRIVLRADCSFVVMGVEPAQAPPPDRAKAGGRGKQRRGGPFYRTTRSSKTCAPTRAKSLRWV